MVSRRTALLLLTTTLWDDHVTAWTLPSPLSLSIRISHPANRRRTTTSLVQAFPGSDYGRGSEIWPPVGSDEIAIQLHDSFPGGVLPPAAVEMMQSPAAVWLTQSTTPTATTTTTTTRRSLPWQIRLAKSLAPWWVGLVLVPCLRCLRPLDVLLVTFITGYTILLQRLSQMNRSDTDFDDVTIRGLAPQQQQQQQQQPILPALPPQGHVPWSVKHPLGYGWTHSWAYRQWLRLGFVLGIVAPVVLLGYDSVSLASIVTTAATTTATTTVATTTTTMTAASPPLILARPLFLLVCQMLTETVVQRQATVTPLPLRVFVPVAYNTVRLGYLWQSALCAASRRMARSSSSSSLLLTTIVDMVAVANFVYWTTNLFGFLLPVAVIRYMRAHFFAVEASRVVTHHGRMDGGP